MKKILVILGHPSTESLNNALADRYAEGARQGGAEVRMLKLGQMQFDPILHNAFNGAQELEPDLKYAQESILWADHLVWVFPSWWGSMPALLKGFIDRAFLPGFAFKYRKNSPWWDKFFTGRTARILITMDTPYIYNWLVYRNANIRALKTATLQFCGIKKVRTSVFDRVRFAPADRVTTWLNKVQELGRKEAQGPVAAPAAASVPA